MNWMRAITCLVMVSMVIATLATTSAKASNTSKIEEVYFHDASFLRTVKFAPVMARILKAMGEIPLQPVDGITVYRHTYYMSFQTPYVIRVEMNHRNNKCRVITKEFLPKAPGIRDLVTKKHVISINEFLAFEKSFLDAQPVESSYIDCNDGGCDIVEMQTPEIYHAVVSDGITSVGMTNLKGAFQKIVPYLPRESARASIGTFSSRLTEFEKSMKAGKVRSQKPRKRVSSQQTSFTCSLSRTEFIEKQSSQIEGGVLSHSDTWSVATADSAQNVRPAP